MDLDTLLDLGDGTVIPLRSALGYQESWSEVGAPSFRQTFRGRAIVLTQTYKRKYSITISASGPGVWRQPAFDHLEAGAELTLHSARTMTAMIPAGTKQCVLSRPHVPGSVRVIRTINPEREDVIPHTEHPGRIIRIAANAQEHYAVLWRPMPVVLLGNVSFDADALAGTGSWTCELMERDAPQ